MSGLVISGGRVVDPASGMDAIGDVAVVDGRISAVGTGLGGAERVIDATGLVVAPGFIDLHAHGQSIPADRMQAFDGVTTTLDLEAGVLPVASWYRRQAAKGRVLNYGAAANWAFARIGAMTGSNTESSLEAFGNAMRDRRWIDNVASDTEVAGILDRLANGLNEGGIGIGILNAYAPGAGVQELTAVCQLAKAHDVATFTHVAYMSRIDPESAAEAYIRLIGYAGATGAHMHICHFNSSSKTDVERCAVLVAKAQAQGLPITVEAYPYGTGSTVLAAAFFSDPEFETRNGLGYDSVQRVTDGRRFRDRKELLAAQAEEPSTLVLWHILDTENNPHHRDLLDISVLYPGGAIASDAMPWTLSDGSAYTGDAWPLPKDATSHPRSAGCFTRFIREWVRERRAVSLLEGLRKCALIPAEILAASTPAMRAKGRLQPGADADIVVFDFDTLTDRATFSAMNRPAEGVRHLVVSGQPLISDGVLDVAARPGRPVRRPVAESLIVPVPILLVTGFLGAGKTTVVNHLLAHAEGRRIAAVVNDFGAINIDAELIAGASDGVVSLSNGCICCSLEGDLLRTLATLLRRDPRPEFIVIETSGVADPSDIVRNLMDPLIWREAPLETVLCVVDATTAPETLNDALPRSQLRAADVVALSKVDLVDAAGRAQLCDVVRALRPAAVVVDALHGEVPTALLFPADVDQVPAPREVGPRRPAADRFETLSWTSERPVSLPRLQQAIGRLAPKLARAKGLFETVEQPGRLTVFQLAGGRATLAPGGALPAGVPRARIVFIAEIGVLSTAEIDGIMEACIEAG